MLDIFSQTAKSISDDYDFLQSKIEEFWQFNSDKKEISFSSLIFLQKHLAEQRLILRKMLEQILGNLENVEFGTLEEIRFLIASQKNKNQNMLLKNLKIEKKGDIVKICQH